MNEKVIWFDFTNVPHVNFLLPIMNHFSEYQQIYSVRDFAETKGLFEKTVNKNYYLIGKHMGKNKFMKVYGSFIRISRLYRRIPQFDVKISVGGDASSIVTKLRGKKSITFDDNERAPNWRYSKFSDLAFWPKAIDRKILLKQGFKSDNLRQYNGFKEDLYIADYTPDPSFLDLIPFKDYVVVRPENIEANYANGSSISIVPKLLELLRDLNKNVLFLPRYSHDRELSLKHSHVFMPSTAINGLDACYYSEAVFTGAGTMAREAGCLGIPAFSFYTGKELLTVDKKMIEEEWLYFSRDPQNLIEKFLNTEKRKPNLVRSKNVKSEILNSLDTFFMKNNLRY